MPSTLTLELPSTTLLHVTPQQFEELATANPELRLERTAQGELIVNPPTGGESSQRNSSLTGKLDLWDEANEDLGVAFDSSGRAVSFSALISLLRPLKVSPS